MTPRPTAEGAAAEGGQHDEVRAAAAVAAELALPAAAGAPRLSRARAGRGRADELFVGEAMEPRPARIVIFKVLTSIIARSKIYTT